MAILAVPAVLKDRALYARGEKAPLDILAEQASNRKFISDVTNLVKKVTQLAGEFFKSVQKYAKATSELNLTLGILGAFRLVDLTNDLGKNYAAVQKSVSGAFFSEANIALLRTGLDFAATAAYFGALIAGSSLAGAVVLSASLASFGDITGFAGDLFDLNENAQYFGVAKASEAAVAGDADKQVCAEAKKYAFIKLVKTISSIAAFALGFTVYRIARMTLSLASTILSLAGTAWKETATWPIRKAHELEL